RETADTVRHPVQDGTVLDASMRPPSRDGGHRGCGPAPGTCCPRLNEAAVARRRTPGGREHLALPRAVASMRPPSRDGGHFQRLCFCEKTRGASMRPPSRDGGHPECGPSTSATTEGLNEAAVARRRTLRMRRYSASRLQASM